MATSKKNPRPIDDIQAKQLPLEQLHLDVGNPRFGSRMQGVQDERKILDEIVEAHGIKDVLSSIAANGFFSSEPLVGAINKDHHGDEVVILEGNRRLAACLILAGDERAVNQAHRRQKYPDSHFKQGGTVPVLVYDWSDTSQRHRLLPYLGVRHIVGSAPWDSYAKASWVASVLDEGAMTLDQIVEMIGDSNHTVARILDGFYFIQQVNDTGLYDTTNSQRKGRGSNPDFPFSWVYSALDYPSIREFVGISTGSTTPAKNPVPHKKITQAVDLMTFMFGDRSRGKAAAVSDSRRLPDLAAAVSNPDSLRMLRDGVNVEDARRKTRPADEQIEEYVFEANRLAEEALTLATNRDLEESSAERLEKSSKRLAKTARGLQKKLSEIASGFDDEENEGDDV